jgi:hypothetical protein
VRGLLGIDPRSNALDVVVPIRSHLLPVVFGLIGGVLRLGAEPGGTFIGVPGCGDAGGR